MNWCVRIGTTGHDDRIAHLEASRLEEIETPRNSAIGSEPEGLLPAQQREPRERVGVSMTFHIASRDGVGSSLRRGGARRTWSCFQTITDGASD